jgi:hypothetical protein
MTPTFATSPPLPSRLLGAAGILGGSALLSAFVVWIPDWSNVGRLVLFNIGAMAVIVAVHRRQASIGSRLGLLVASTAVLANAWYLVMILLSIGRPVPPEPDAAFRLVMFYAGFAMWLADSAFGFVTLRLGVVTRWGALALAIGSLLAILGMSHLELTTPANPTIFGPLSLIGICLNGLGWILLGVDVATRDRRLPDDGTFDETSEAALG